MNKPEAADERARTQALDPLRSFIVQAPAGSGKTGLLTQRYLRLLACVDAPEEIVAITFTRKAAGEMRERIVRALEAADNDVPPEQAHERRSWELARAARARDLDREWHLAAHPARLRIQTIDSLNAEFTRQMPVLSGFGAQPAIAQHPRSLYREAARRTLECLEQDELPQRAAIAALLGHLDNDLSRTTDLLAEMLPQRDQWLRLTGAGDGAGRRERLERAFEREISHQLQRLTDAFPRHLRDEVAALAGYAAGRLRARGADSALEACIGLQAFPAASPDALPVWRGLAELLLTQGNAWRKRVDTSLGFEAGGHKTRLTQVLSELNTEDELLALFTRVRALPAPDFEATQWQALEALLEVLPFCAAQLQVLFSERGEVDYAEVALRALTALGTDTAPTDLALALDMRIRHLLVDEFQDTSFNQFTLLERLTAGWQPGDGRTLFLVGDPMQSIYRFREAEVSLFLRAQQQGVGSVQLESLTLNRNFRSQPGIVNWVNAGFSRVFAARSDLLSGAVCYSPSIAASGIPESADAVEVHVSFSREAEREADDMLAVIRAARARGHGVAVLVRGRQHLLALMPVLRRTGLAFRAVELEKLARRPVVQDLLALTRALLHPADRSAWLAVLRAPWCGLRLVELEALCGDDTGATLPVLLQDEARRAALGADAQRRLARVTEILLDARHHRRGSLREQVEQAWLRLAGPATCMTESDTVDAEAYLALLETLDEGGMLAEPGVLLEALEDLYALPDPHADDSLQLMTIHKAKGLEFDVVIVPALGVKPRNRTRPLLAHLERIRDEHDPDLLLSPLNARGSDQDPLYELVHALRGEQEAFENQRLMYVAATRARHHLHLFGHTGYSEKNGQRSLRAPAARSLLATLWPALQPDFQAALDARTASQHPAPESAAAVVRRLRRLPVDWRPPAPAPDLGGAEPETLAAEAPDSALEFEWAGDTLRHVGSVVHRVLQRISEDAPAAWSAERLHARATLLRDWLQEAGVPQQELDRALANVLEAVTRTLADPDGRRILMARGPEAHSEYALSCRDGRRLLTGVIDRTFVDNDGTRWIVDYKTSRHEGADLDAFLASEAVRYRAQLAGYVRLMRLHEQRPIRAGLYFPLLGRFLAVDVT